MEHHQIPLDPELKAYLDSVESRMDSLVCGSLAGSPQLGSQHSLFKLLLMFLDLVEYRLSTTTQKTEKEYLSIVLSKVLDLIKHVSLGPDFFSENPSVHSHETCELSSHLLSLWLTQSKRSVRSEMTGERD